MEQSMGGESIDEHGALVVDVAAPLVTNPARFAPIRRFFHTERRSLYLKAVSHGIFGMAPVLITLGFLFLSERHDSLGIDFNSSFWPADHRFLTGGPLYVPDTHAVATGEAFAYPAVGALLLVPFALLPHGIASFIFAALCVASVPLTLWILSVRDWRVYGVAMLWWPVISGWQVANTTLLFGVGIALVWRYRDRVILAGALVALLVSAKVFLWPLAVWLLATRRYAALAYAAAWTLLFNLVAWTIVGFDQLSSYEKSTTALVSYERRGAGPLAWLLSQGVDKTAAYLTVLAVAALVCGLCYSFGRRGNDRGALALAIFAALLATPVVWIHYYALFVVPVAVARPRLALVWGVPCLLATYAPLAGMPTLQMGVVTLVTACLLVVALAQPSLDVRPAEGF